MAGVGGRKRWSAKVVSKRKIRDSWTSHGSEHPADDPSYSALPCILFLCPFCLAPKMHSPTASTRSRHRAILRTKKGGGRGSRRGPERGTERGQNGVRTGHRTGLGPVQYCRHSGKTRECLCVAGREGAFVLMRSVLRFCYISICLGGSSALARVFAFSTRCARTNQPGPARAMLCLKQSAGIMPASPMHSCLDEQVFLLGAPSLSPARRVWRGEDHEGAQTGRDRTGMGQADGKAAGRASRDGR